MKVLAVFPPLHEENAGGIQVAGQIAWRALQQHTDAQLLEVSARGRLRALRQARAVRFDADVVLFWHLDLLRLAPLLPKPARRAVFLHGIEAWRRPDPLTRLLVRNTAIIANSRYTVDRARENMPGLDADVRVVHLGLGDATGSCAPAETPVALMIGRLDASERYKGHHEVIAAWPQVLEQIADAQLWIVGEGELRSELETQVRDQQLTESVRFFGRVSEAEKQALVCAARCLALPSRGEGFGLVYLEAMRAGRPCVVGTDAGREVVNPPEAGIAVEPADTPALASAIVTLLTPGMAWQSLSDAARRRYEAGFTAGHFQARLLAALRELN